MGCGGSKCDPKEDILPAKIRPLLLRRFDEMRRRSRTMASSSSLAANLSKKELLKEAIVSDDDNSAHRNHFGLGKITTSVSHQDSDKIANGGGVVAKAAQPVSSPRSPRVAPEPEHEPEKLQRSSTKPEQDTSGVEDKFRDDGFCPGSPSFRFYFIESMIDDRHEDGNLYADNSDKEDYDSDKKSQTNQSFSEVDSINSDSAKKTKKKTRRVHRLRKVILKGRSGAVKNQLNV